MRLYKSIIENAKTDNRIKHNGIYYEAHHIIPDFMFENRSRSGPKGHLPGDPNDPKNLVLLTTREHVLCHILLAKALIGKRYWAQAASALSWFFTKAIGKHARQDNNSAGMMRKYEKYRAIAIMGVSESRKGKFPAVDAITGECVGSPEVDHPKVLSGEWVHHSTGKHTYLNKITGEKKWMRCVDVDLTIWQPVNKSQIGDKNVNARIYNEDYIKKYLIEFNKIVITKFDNNFISCKFLEWFDSFEHDIFITFRNKNNKIINQKLSGSGTRVTKIVKTIILDLINDGIINWNLPQYGMGKYKGINVC